MAINVTNRKVDVVSSRASNEVLTVALECENTSDIEIYSSVGAKYRNGIDYNVTNNTIPGVSSNTITVTWVGTSPLGTLTVYRTSPRTQTTSLTNDFTNDLLEDALDKMTLADQNVPSTTNGVFDIDDDNIQVVGDPVNDSDAANLGYMQAEYSRGGFIPPPIVTVDAGLTGTGKVLYTKSTTSVIWKDPFDVPYPSSASKILQVNSLGVPEWVSPVDYAPVYPTAAPKYLGVDSSSKAWIPVDQVPTLSKGVVGDTLVFQYDSKPAWRSIRWIEAPPGSGKHLFNNTGTAHAVVDGHEEVQMGSVTTSLVAAAKACSIRENDTDRNNGGAQLIYVKGDSDDAARVPLLEFDCSAFTAYTIDSLISCNLRIYFSSGSSSAARQFIVRRLKNTFVEGTGASGNSYNDDGATWSKPTAPLGTPDWNWGGGSFDPVSELDQELPTINFAVGSGMTTGDYTYIDIKELFLDAIRNRSGILRIALYDPAPLAASKFGFFYSNTGHANDVKVEIKNATERKTYWQPWNYHLIRTHHQADWDYSSFENDFWWFTNPHIMARSPEAANESGEIKGGHVSAGKVFASAFSYSTTKAPASENQFVTPLVCINEDNETVMHFHDPTSKWSTSLYQAFNEIDDYTWHRTATIWLANE